MAKVSYHNVRKSFGSIEVMHDLSLTIEDGEFIVLLGSSGCGKTTLLRMTAGLETISSGEIEIDGRIVNQIPPKDRNIAMVFQNYALYPTMRVRENIAFSLEVAKLPRDEINRRVEEAARVLNLTNFLDRKPNELSGGQRQRVAMGRVMVRNAAVFLFDEPLSNLDAKLRAHMRVEIRQLHDRLGATTIYVTHDQIEAMTMADRIVLMRDGGIVQVGTSDDLYDKPKNIYVAEFIGSPQINCGNGEIATEGGHTFIRTPNWKLPLPSEYSAFTDRMVTFGIRPNDVKLDPSGAIEGKLVIAENTGADMQMHIDIGGTSFVAIVPRHSVGKSGEQIKFSTTPDKIHVFDQVTGDRLTTEP